MAFICYAVYSFSFSSSAITADALAETAATITTTTITTNKINANIPNNKNVITQHSFATNFPYYSTSAQKRKPYHFLFLNCPNHDIMSASEPEQAQLVHGERRMAVTNSCTAAVSATARIRDIMSASEPEQAQLVHGERRIKEMGKLL
jgi:hypothetical protein